MLGSTENHKHVRRRLEPLRMAVWPPVSAATPRANNGPRVCVTVVEAFGVRYRGRMIFDAAMDWSCGGKKPYLANRFVEECVRLSQLRHPNLTMLYGIVMDGPSLTLATDLPVMSLDECLCRYKSIPEFMKSSILLDAACGLLYLHKRSPPIAHTRVSTRSVYVTSSMSAKIGDVGVAGALGEAAADGDDARHTAPSNARMPPQTFVKILETGTKCTDTAVDVPAFGNVIVHTTCQRRWLDPPGHTAVSPYLHTMPVHHPLYSPAYHCLLGGTQYNVYKQVPQVDMDYVVQCLQVIVRNDPSPFHNTLELFQALTTEQAIKQPHDNLTTSPHQHNNFPLQEHPPQDSHIPIPSHTVSQKCNHSQDQSPTPSAPPTSVSSSSNPLPATFISSSTKSSNTNSHNYSSRHVAPHLQSDDHYRSRHNSTGQVRAPPPKPPQRSSSFRRKKSEQVTAAQDSLQRAGSLRIKRMPTVEPSPSQQQTSPVIKINVPGMFAGGSAKQNSLLLPSKFSPVAHREEHSSRGYKPQQDGRYTSLSISVQTSPHPKSVPPSNSSEFERLLARQREKVESHQPVTVPPLPPSTNGEIIRQSSSLEGMKAATDMDLPKKKAPKPPRRTSSFKSYQKPTKYEEKYSNNTSELAFRGYNTAPQFPQESGELADPLPPSSTSPSTGQSRLSSAE